MLRLGRALAVPITLSLIAVACWSFDELTAGGASRPCDGGACVGQEGGPIVPGTDAQPDAPLDCKPRDMTGFTPTWRPPNRQPGKCTSAQIDGFASCLFSTSSAFKQCSDYLELTENKLCGSCLISSPTDAVYGAYTRMGDIGVRVNVEGCVGLVTGDIRATSCAAKAQALAECQSAACASSCPPATDLKSLNAVTACEDDAGATSCQSYVQPADCIRTLLNGSAASCVSGATPLDAAKQVMTYFCGP